MNTKNHYEHLGKFYSWMLGDFDLKSQEQLVFFESHHILPTSTKSAIDLGAGNGIQSIALAKLGFNVTAIDFNSQLLTELKSRSAGYKIEIREHDFLNFDQALPFAPELIICMGDTLLYLASRAEIENLFEKAYRTLTPTGKLALSFRDYTNALEGDNRFIPVKSDEERILTCFLEYSEEYVTVTDLLHEKEGGRWIQKASSYKKVRITPNEVKALLTKFGFRILTSENVNRMMYVVAQK